MGRVGDVAALRSIEKDASLVELADLPLGWYAERVKLGAPWIRSPKPPENAND